MRPNFSFLRDLEATPVKLEAESLPPLENPELNSRLAFVQVGIWEVRRRWLSGQTAELDRLLACLDEDVALLRQALQGEQDEEPDSCDQHDLVPVI
jgi:hypothetical protein